MPPELERILTLPGVSGICLYRSGKVAAERVPPALAARMPRAIQAVSALFQGYWNAGRQVSQVLIEFSGSLIFCLGISSKESQSPAEAESGHFLILFLSTRAHLHQLPEPGLAILKSSPVPDSPAWLSFREGLVHLLGKVMNRAQCDKLIARVLQSLGHVADAPLAASQFEAFGEAVISEVPNRARQAPLRDEMRRLLLSLTIS